MPRLHEGAAVMSKREPWRCPHCHGTNNHAADFDCRIPPRQPETLRRLDALERAVGELCKHNGIAFGVKPKRTKDPVFGEVDAKTAEAAANADLETTAPRPLFTANLARRERKAKR